MIKNMHRKPTIEVWFELENRCNLKCKFCYNYWKDGKHLEPNMLSAQELIICLQNLLTVADCNKIALSGGEPLLRKDLMELVSFINSQNIPMVLTSNGILLTKERITELKRMGVLTFEVPLHSMDSEVHNYLSGIDCFEQSIGTIVMLREQECDVVPVFVATNRNLSHLQNVVNTCSLLGLNSIIFNRFIPSGFGSVNMAEIGVPSDMEVSHMLSNVYELAKEKGVQIHLGVPVNLPSSFKSKVDFIKPASCPVKLSQKRWTLDAGGNLRRCNHSHLSVGNLLKGGEEILAQELAKSYDTVACGDFHPCQFIETGKKFSVSVL
jgi:MoaA/NifB/PqqE/SkfB family radical SAM enzyme